ncbi:hypothetical protein ACIPY0_12210 [Paenarthrobacter nicotinovorans]|uniref:hypothetical protein n=1 Tax=Paenarthrobacter nicotinovorans TaxID=29320 RepID=UPI0037F10A4E
MTGPTTVGSIDAKLTIDKSDWNRDRDEAKAEAAELGALNPEIKVDANVGPALAKLEAVAKAERDLESAYMRSAIAQQKLDLATQKHGEDSLQAAQARLTLKRATDAESDSEAKLAAAKDKTRVAHEMETESAERALRTRRANISGIQVLLALAPAIVAAAGPVAGAAVGLGAAFGIMAVSGVIAIKGIKDEMQEGTAAGNQYAAGLGSLKGNLDELSGTAANRMLGAFKETVGDINERMPALNRGVGDGAAALGNMGGTALRNVLDGLGAMAPLLEGGTVQLSKFVFWVTNFSQAQGFQSFVAYATTNLPAVMGMIEKLVVLGGNILAAFAPLGPVVIGFISGTADALNGVPLPVLAGIVTTSVLIGPALRIAFAPGVATLIVSVAQAIGLTGVMANLAVPVVGLLTAVIAGIGIAAATSAMGTDQGTASLTNYTQALKDDKDAIGEHTRASAAKALADADAFNSARELGISQKTLTDAVLGSKDAIDKVNEAVRKGKEFQNDWSQGVVDANTGIYVATQAQDDMGKAIDNVTKQLSGQSKAIADAKQQNADFEAATRSTNGSLTDEARTLQESAALYGVSVAVYESATGAQKDTATQLADTTLKMQLQNDAAGLLRQAWDLLNGSVLSLDQAQTRSAAATNSLTDSFKTNGVAIIGTSTAVVANQQALQNKVAADQAMAEAVAKSTGRTQDGTAAFAAAKSQLEKNLAAQGLLTAEVQTYIDKLYAIPASVPKTKVEVDTAAAEEALNYLARRRTAQIDVIQRNYDSGSGNAPGAGQQVSAFEHGGNVNYLATGGPPTFIPRGTDTVPAMLTPDEFVMKRSSAKSIGLPALNYMNQTGQLPATAAPAQPVTATIQLVLDGRVLDTRTVSIVDGMISEADAKSQHKRRGR